MTQQNSQPKPPQSCLFPRLFQQFTVLQIENALMIRQAPSHHLCAMLPYCDRIISVARKNVAPVWIRSFPIEKEPTTLGQHLKKRRFLAGMRRAETAVNLGVSERTLSLWETDRVYPAWAFQPRLI